MQTDPIGYGDGMNMYAYVHGDPVNGVDPTGLSCSNGQVPLLINNSPRSIGDTIGVYRTTICIDIYIRPEPSGDPGGGASVIGRKGRVDPEPQKEQLTKRQAQIGCFGAAFEKNVLSLALDGGGLLLTVVAPEEKLAQLGIASAGIIASSFSGYLPGLGNRIAGYHAIALDSQFLSKAGNLLVKGVGAFTGVAGVANDLRNIGNETAACRRNGGQ